METMFLPHRLFEIELRRSSCFKDFLLYKRVIDKVDKCSERIKFLEKCRDSDIIPKFLNFRIPNNGCFDQNSIHEFQRRLLLKEIVTAKKQLAEHDKTLSSRRSSLRDKLPHKLLHSVIRHSRFERRNNRHTVQHTHNKKTIEFI